jgi:hypothetical protein
MGKCNSVVGLVSLVVLILVSSCGGGGNHSSCDFDDGVHAATVNYSNSNTGYSNTYSLDVEVENCEVVRINFPNGGWLDSDHITPAELDGNGQCTIEGEGGKTYEVEIDN